LKMEGIQTLKGSWPWPWPWIRSYGIPSCITHRPLPTYQISFKSKKLFVDGRTDGSTDGHFSPSNIIRSTFGSRPKNRNSSLTTLDTVGLCIHDTLWSAWPEWHTYQSGSRIFKGSPINLCCATQFHRRQKFGVRAPVSSMALAPMIRPSWPADKNIYPMQYHTVYMIQPMQ